MLTLLVLLLLFCYLAAVISKGGGGRERGMNLARGPCALVTWAKDEGEEVSARLEIQGRRKKDQLAMEGAFRDTNSLRLRVTSEGEGGGRRFRWDVELGRALQEKRGRESRFPGRDAER
jgi:hypothetical protein